MSVLHDPEVARFPRVQLAGSLVPGRALQGSHQAYKRVASCVG